ncbi:hypothetical protein [Magnetospirillum sulfuroxidans]|uniref:Uncharacterized protein n=1 Tax=Magnetospirillum sulfuroxidans TaxID=611300 RepID=A0ABS5I8V2_9PROT|nr:hypothetical protein [Magnetospirillum sulfuroxidans]MBR9970835.1 hypothetical protein [Magnetospirillum sulfuroxidans]
MDDDDRLARIAAAIVEHFDIRAAQTVAELDDGLRFHNYLIRQIGTVRPDLYDRLKDLAQSRRSALSKDSNHG